MIVVSSLGNSRRRRRVGNRRRGANERRSPARAAPASRTASSCGGGSRQPREGRVPRRAVARATDAPHLDRGIQRLQRLAPAQRLCRRAQVADWPVNTARDSDRAERSKHDREQDTAAVDCERAVRRTLDQGRWNAGGGRPAAVLEPAERGVVPASLEVMGLAPSGADGRTTPRDPERDTDAGSHRRTRIVAASPSFRR